MFMHTEIIDGGDRINTTAIIAAGGRGTRFGKNLPGDLPKQYYEIDGKPIIAYTLEKFENHPLINEIILTSPPGFESFSQKIINRYGFTKVSKIITGGTTRSHTVYNALKQSDGAQIVLIHDGARPFVSHEEIDASVDGAKKYGACAVGVPVKDTIKICDDEGFVIETPVREKLRQIMTPQSFLFNIIMDAYERGLATNAIVTDDLSMVEMLGGRCRIINGSYANIKITTIDDLTKLRR
ncbi:MAG: 2-C-methyl-D-erythritol 4-phosphate cytidylyltransferase [Clostridiales bacterium]|jgi:2-C-methyl-D-erythritol 4-phosphate cytidylyltransferase|nr:2-C-methyl-D-erythritol 4-phosphate cytidylyltransferase [Clostridiales bacterium]